MDWQEKKDTVQKIVDWLLFEAEDSEIMDAFNYIFPPDDGQE